jgi:hypothetical protein
MFSKVSSMPQKDSHPDSACKPWASNPWTSSPMEAQARFVPPKLSTKQGPAKEIGTPSKNLKSKYHGK